MTLALKMKKLRMRKGQSLQQVADAVGVSKAHIWELERGSSKNPGIELLTRLASHFNVTISFLVDEKGDYDDAAALQFFREFEGKLSDEDWDALRSIADRLQGKER